METMNTETELVLNEIIKLVNTILKIPVERIDVTADFASYGMDSIIAMELMANLSKRLHLKVTPAQFSQVRSIEELAEVLAPQIDITSAPKNSDIRSTIKAEKISTDMKSDSRDLVGKKPEDLLRFRDFVKSRFSIDLDLQPFKSKEDVVSFLLEKNFHQLSRFYSPKSDSMMGQAKENSINKTRSVAIPVANDTGASASDVAIIGISCQLPGANNYREFWQGLINSECQIKEIPDARWASGAFYSEIDDAEKNKTGWAALLDSYDHFDNDFFGISDYETVLIDPQERLLIQQVYKAFQDACITRDQYESTKTGVFVGYEYTEYEHYIRRLQTEKKLTCVPKLSSAGLSFYLANRISYLFNLKGPSEAINVNCASSAVAINRAYSALLRNECELAVVAGVSLNLFADDYIALAQQGLFSDSGRCSVFDEKADGYTRGEGVCVLILKKISQAQSDANPIHAVIKNVYQNDRGKAAHLSEIEHASITELLRDSYRAIQKNISDLDYLEVNGYATRWGDSFEFEGIKNVFDKNQYPEKSLALGSLKGNIGHTEPVNGIAACIKIALSLKEKIFPKTITATEVNKFIDFASPTHSIYLADESIEFDSIRRNRPVLAGVNSFADSGVNVHIILEEYLNNRVSSPVTRNAYLFVLSAKTQYSLHATAKEYLYFIREHQNVSPCNLSYSLQLGRDSFSERLAIVYSNLSELEDRLIKYIDSKTMNFDGTDGIYLGLSLSIEENAGSQENFLVHQQMGAQHTTATRKADSLIARLASKEVIDAQMNDCVLLDQWNAVADLWTRGIDIPWQKAWLPDTGHFISLPTYCFDQKPFGIDKLCDEYIAQLSIEPQSAVTSCTDRELVHPRNPVEYDLKEIWINLLNIPPDCFGVTDRFFELGASSKNAIQLMSEINQKYASQFSLPDLVSHDTIAELAGLVSELGSLQKSLCVPLQAQGESDPLYTIPGAGGSVLSLTHLSIALGKHRPVFGFQAAGLDGTSKPLNDVKKIAVAYINSMSLEAKAKPINLLGYSNGGVVAFEIAYQLLQQGYAINSLIIIDAVAPSGRSFHVADEMLAITSTYMRSEHGSFIDIDPEYFRRLSNKKRKQVLFDALKNAGLAMPKAMFSLSYDVALASDTACRNYQPKPLLSNINAHFIRATNSYQNLDESYGWTSFFPQLTIHELDTNHEGLLIKPTVDSLAVVINKIIGK